MRTKGESRTKSLRVKGEGTSGDRVKDWFKKHKGEVWYCEANVKNSSFVVKGKVDYWKTRVNEDTGFIIGKGARVIFDFGDIDSFLLKRTEVIIIIKQIKFSLSKRA